MGSGASNQNQVCSNDAKENNTAQASAHSGRPLPKTRSNPQKDIQKGQRIPNETKNSPPIRKTTITKIETIPPIESKSTLDTEQPVINLGKVNETNSNNLNQRIKELEKELAASESKKLDLQEKIQLLEERLDVQSQQPPKSDSQTLPEALNAKEQCILQIKKDSQTAQNEANKLRLKLKRRIKGLTNQLHEARQEASITQMELKAEITRLTDKLKEKLGGNSSPSLDSGSNGKESTRRESGDSSGGHSKIIVELSNQLSEQSEQISKLMTQMSEKDKRIEELETMCLGTNSSISNNPTASQDANHWENKVLSSTSTDRLHSSRGQRVFKQPDTERQQDNMKGNIITSEQKSISPKPLERQSTALSDSDSDWEVDSIPSHTRSAPSRSRIKSAMSLSKSDHHKSSLVTLNGDDDSIVETTSNAAANMQSDRRLQMQKKSTFKSQLERKRIEKQSHSLMGPSLAFVNKTDQFSDTSCEPTPRYPNSRFSSYPKVTTVTPIDH